MVVFQWFRLWAPLGALLGPSWPILWVSGWPLAPPWGLLGTCLGYWGASWCLLGRPWDLVGASWWLLVPPWESLGTCLAYLGDSWWLLGPPWDLDGASSLGSSNPVQLWLPLYPHPLNTITGRRFHETSFSKMKF